MYVDEFLSKKKQNQKNISTQFMKLYQELQGHIGIEELDKLLIPCIPALSASAIVKYPNLVAIRRAFLYALLCGENDSKITAQALLAGCNRVGIDNPAPSVAKRWSFYGNEEDFEEVLRRELVKYNIST